MHCPLPRSSWLSGVAAASANDVWAVGGSGAGEERKPLVVHFDGERWRVVDLRGAAPTPGTPFSRLEGTYLTAITAASPTNIWTVGERLIARYSC